MKKLVIALGLVFGGCTSYEEWKAADDKHYAGIKSVCGVDPSKGKPNRHSGRYTFVKIGMKDKCLKAQFGTSYKRNVSVSKYGTSEQLVYPVEGSEDNSKPKYIYLENGVVTSYSN
jgi:hypothetical protein